MRNYSKASSLLILAGLITMPIAINGCGMLVHMDVTERALNSFTTDSSYPYDQVLRKHHSYVQAGSPFPDWGYLCKTPAGEDSHWPPFVNAYKAYMESKYEKGTEQYDKLMAFLFGVESHIQADVEWHWGRKTNTTESQGFLQSMSHDGSDCKDDWDTDSQNPNCHSIGDTGADFYLGARGEIDWYNETWTIPTDDLQEIYKTMNLPNETSEKIFQCTSTMFVGSILEKHFSGLITFYFDQHASFLTEDLDLWYHGGLDDMGTNVAWKWQQLTNMFDQKKQAQNSKGSAPSCSVFGQDFLKEKLDHYAKLVGVTFTKDSMGHHTYSVDKKRMMGSAQTIIDSLFQDLGIQQQPYQAKSQKSSRPSLGEPQETIQSQKAFTYLGKGLAIGDFNGDGVQEMFVGAPGYGAKGFGSLGAVYYASLNQSNNGFDATAPYLTQNETYQRFGFALTAIDINRDGIDDLVVSAPAYGDWAVTDIGDYYPKSYFGKLYVYLGKKDVGIVQGSQADFEIRSRLNNDVFFNMGLHLKSSDCNGDGQLDLIVLSPLSQQGGDKRGHLGVFFNLDKLDQTNKVLYLEDADFSLNGSDDYEWFGYDAVCTNDQVLIVGAPGKRPGQYLESAGAVYGFNIKDGSMKFKIESPEFQSKFGKVINYRQDTNILVVGAPSRNSGIMYHSGAVYIYNLSNPNLDFDHYQAVIRSNDRGSRFGAQIQWIEETLVVSAPALSTWNSLKVPNDQGIIYTYNNGEKLTGVLSADVADQQFETLESGCRHGETMRFSEKTNQLIVGSPFCQNNEVDGTIHRLAGRLFIFNTGATKNIEKEFIEKSFLAY